jgi:hypothetical protein
MRSNRYYVPGISPNRYYVPGISKTGRPMGGEQFIADLEIITGRDLMLKTAGRPRNEK